MNYVGEVIGQCQFTPWQFKSNNSNIKTTLYLDVSGVPRGKLTYYNIRIFRTTFLNFHSNTTLSYFYKVLNHASLFYNFKTNRLAMTPSTLNGRVFS